MGYKTSHVGLAVRSVLLTRREGKDFRVVTQKTCRLSLLLHQPLPLEASRHSELCVGSVNSHLPFSSERCQKVILDTCLSSPGVPHATSLLHVYVIAKPAGDIG